MKLAIDRGERDAHAIRSALTIDGVPAGYVLERVGYEIPAGRYALELKTLGHSRFDGSAMGMMTRGGSSHRGMIRLVNVPGRSEILIHWGNYWADSKGCLLVGANEIKAHGGDLAVGLSRDAYVRIYRTVAAAIQAGGAEIVVSEPERRA